MLYFPRPTVRQEVFEYVLVAFNEMAVERLNQCENIVVLSQECSGAGEPGGFYRSLQSHQPMEEEMAVRTAILGERRRTPASGAPEQCIHLDLVLADHLNI